MTDNHHTLSPEHPQTAVLRCQKAMLDVQQALQKSQAIEEALQASIQASWGCPQAALEKKLTAIFGEPTDQQLYIARQAFDDRFVKSDTLAAQKVQKPFVVHNPI